MKICRVLTALSCVLFFSACAVVFSDKKVGEEPFVLETEAWEGTWMHKDGAMVIEVLDAAQGLLQLSWIENMELESNQVQLLASGDWIFGNIKDDKHDNRYLWGRVKKESRQIILWIPSASAFQRLVKDKTLPGVLDDDGNVILDQLTPAHYKLIREGTEGVLFDWDEPAVLFRITE